MTAAAQKLLTKVSPKKVKESKSEVKNWADEKTEIIQALNAAIIVLMKMIELKDGGLAAELRTMQGLNERASIKPL